MNRLIPLLLTALCLLASPVSAGWFDTPLLLHVKHSDPKEIHDLLDTLVPDAKYEVSGSTITVTGSPEALAQVRECFRELDKPLSRVSLEVYGFEVLDGSLGNLGTVRTDSTRERGQSTGPIYFRSLVRSHSDPAMRSDLSKDGLKLLYSNQVRTVMESTTLIYIPDDVAVDIFGAEKCKLIVGFELRPQVELFAHFTLMSSREPVGIRYL